MQNKEVGFTLIELLVVVAIAAVILAIAVPSFAEFQRNSRITAAANDLLGAIQTARTEAIRSQSAVAVCPSADPAAKAPTCGGTFVGWIAFADTNNNCLRDAGEEVLRAGGSVGNSPGNPLNAISDGVCISFAGTGFLQTIPDRASATRTLFCDSRGSAQDPAGNLPNGIALTYARGIDVTRTGRARVTRDSAEIGAWAPAVACP